MTIMAHRGSPPSSVGGGVTVGVGGGVAVAGGGGVGTGDSHGETLCGPGHVGIGGGDGYTGCARADGCHRHRAAVHGNSGHALVTRLSLEGQGIAVGVSEITGDVQPRGLAALHQVGGGDGSGGLGASLDASTSAKKFC